MRGWGKKTRGREANGRSWNKVEQASSQEVVVDQGTSAGDQLERSSGEDNDLMTKERWGGGE